ncbi:hypothetical protein PINS_up007603 [Pythium insidiosum]|nr:hypothetical protein PINS_up007603 [Pythium insidiosum]
MHRCKRQCLFQAIESDDDSSVIIATCLDAPPACDDDTNVMDVFYSAVYLTKGTQDLTHPVDQRFASAMRYGCRPDVRGILTEVGLDAKDQHSGSRVAVLQDANEQREPRVAVLVCGPAALVADAVLQSMLLTKELGVAFDVHQETFDF